MNTDKLGGLHDFAVFVRASADLHADLAELVERAAAATGAATCSIMLLSEGDSGTPRLKLWCATKALPPSAWDQTTAPGESIAGRVLLEGEPLLVADIDRSEFAGLARRRDNQGVGFICVPITIRDRTIGVMNLTSRPGQEPFDESHLTLALIVATLIAKSVQVERLQTLLRSRVAQISLARQGKEVVGPLVEGTIAPAKVAKLLAKSFFKDLSAAGFEPGQIIDAAGEIISLVSNDLVRYRRRVDRRTPK